VPFGDVDAAAEGQCIVNDRDLLVVAAAWRVVPVQMEVETMPAEPFEQEERRRAAERHLEKGEIPAQHINAQPRITPHGVVQQRANPVRNGGWGTAAAVEFDTGVEIPADEQD
jgi:hypothetical protein